MLVIDYRTGGSAPARRPWRTARATPAASITPLGRSLLPVVLGIKEWAEQNMPRPGSPTGRGSLSGP
jgi:DNA-binding HxlR family transcriptional regulator